MQIFVCDDERQMVDSIVNLIEEQVETVGVRTFYDGESLWEAMMKERCDVLFLDIDMPQISGLDIAGRLSELSHKPLLVFVTSHDELVYDSLRFHPFGFIRKSYLQQELGVILEDCMRAVGVRTKSFAFLTAEGNRRIALEDIFYFEAEGNYLKLYTRAGLFRFRSTLYAVENALAGNGFIRVHKGYLVNQAAVRLIGKDELVLENEERIPIGKSYGEDAKKKLLREFL